MSTQARPSTRSSTRTSTRTRASTATPASSTTSLSSTPSAAPGTVGRMTRLRAAKEGAGTGGAALSRTNTGGTGGLLAKGKEGLRNFSDKMKDKEKETSKPRPVAGKRTTMTAVSAPVEPAYTESLQAFLRIRPPPPEADLSPTSPYLEIKDGQNVVMTAPPDGARHHIPKPPHTYSFDRVFGPNAQQQDFFEKTTLPLVEKLLRGHNGLMFAYGVSNSGKTYTIQGGNENGLEQRGVLPRSLDVVFNSISGLESKANLKCQGLADVVLTDEADSLLSSLAADPEARIEDTVKVDRNFSYAVFVSYAEVYNEKVFDLLDSVLPTSRPAVSNIPRTMSMGVGISSGIGTSMSLAAMANGGAGILKRRALVLKNDPEGTGKYISGLNEIRVRTREEALALFRSGQRARQVFGTMANRASSRSHGIFTIKVVRIHNGAPHDPESAQVSRLAIVDLAGSERTRNTATTGDRLKEAGNINKSLMVLGQCIEVLRANQQKMNAPGSITNKRRLAVVPFRHSKLTEIFQSFFVGDGCAVMIVHVNPYDTGFDENSNVMKFSAVAQEISTVQAPRTPFPTLKKQISSQFSALKNAVSGHVGGQKIRVMVPVMPKTSVTVVNVGSSHSSFSRPTAASANRISTASASTSRPSTVVGRASATRVSRLPSRPITPEQAVDLTPPADQITIVEEEIEVVEEEPEEEEDDDEHDYLVDYLFEELKQLKTQLYESEMRNAAVEMEIRQEVAREMQATIQRMHVDFNRRLQEQNALGDEKADKKIDILQRTIGVEDTSVDDSYMSEDSDDTMSVNTADLETSVLVDPFESAPIPRHRASTEALETEASFTTAQCQEPDASIDESIAEDANESCVEHKGEVSDDDSEGDADESRVESLGPDDSRLTSDESGLVGSDEEDETGSEELEGSELDDDEDGTEDEQDEEDEDAVSGSGSDLSFTEGNESTSTVATPPRSRRTSPNSKKLASARQPTGGRVSAARPKDSVTAPKRVLRDSTVQPLKLVSDDEDHVIQKNTPVKKKRALGKKIITEDEIEAINESAAGGAEVRRMVRGM